MDISDAMTGMDIIRRTAEHFEVTEDEIRKDIQAVIDEAWSTGDSHAKAYQTQLFPNGKPCLEDFILTVAKQVKAQPQ